MTFIPDCMSADELAAWREAADRPALPDRATPDAAAQIRERDQRRVLSEDELFAAFGMVVDKSPALRPRALDDVPAQTAQEIVS